MPVCRILWSFKLNPYERLNLRFTATPDEIRKQFRKLSLMVHPDKCKHAQAAEAFDSEWPAGGGMTAAGTCWG
jgi:DnaJ family protein C protein 8